LLVGCFGSTELVLGLGLLVLEVLEWGAEGLALAVLVGDGLFGDGDLDFDLLGLVLKFLESEG
jgi:hypothetical protein